MSVPATRQDFGNWCLRKLGHPVIQINVDQSQIDDRIDEALRYYFDYHTDGTCKQFYKYQVTQDDINNSYITLPEGIIGAVDFFPITGTNETNNIFDIRYQIALNDLYTLTSQSLIPYYQAMQALQFYEQILVGIKPMRYNRNNNIFYIDMAWEDYLQIGQYIIICVYQQIDPNQNPTVWSDRWLQRYATALIKQQWADNMFKFKDVQMVGGVTLNAGEIWKQANDEILKLEKEMERNYAGVLNFYSG